MIMANPNLIALFRIFACGIDLYKMSTVIGLFNFEFCMEHPVTIKLITL